MKFLLTFVLNKHALSMVILSKRIINTFSEKEPRSTDALLHWYKNAKAASWGNFSEMKRTFSSVDAVGTERYVFNIKGNDYRLIAKVHFDIRTIYILFIGTHAQYDEINASTVTHKN